MNHVMTDNKPYFLRAVYEWILDNNCTPHLVIASPGAGWVHGVPLHLLQESSLVLNISPIATENCIIDNESITFNTRFGGQPHSVWVATKAVISLVARENGEGISFPIPDDIENGPKQPPDQTVVEKQDEKKAGNNKKPSHLKIIK